MPDKMTDIPYIKSPLWRVVSATGAAVVAFAGPAGAEQILHFTTEWVDVEKETALADVNQQAGTMAIKGPSQPVAGPISKLEEVAVRLPMEGAANLAIAILQQFDRFSDPTKQRLREEFAKHG